MIGIEQNAGIDRLLYIWVKFKSIRFIIFLMLQFSGIDQMTQQYYDLLTAQAAGY